MTNYKLKGMFEMFLATFIWGSIPLFSIWCGLPSPVFVFFRVLFALPFILIYSVKRIGLKEFIDVKSSVSLIFSGVALALNWILFFWAIDLTSISTAVIFYYLGPVFTIILAVIFLREPLNKSIIVATVLAFFGAFLTFVPSFEKGNLLGLAVAFASGVMYGILGFISKIATLRHSPLKVTAYQILISLFFTFPFVLIFKIKLTFLIIFLLFITGIIHTALALFLWYDSLNYIRVSTSAIFSYLDPFFAMLLGFVFLSQVPTAMQITGGAFIALAGIVASFGEYRKG